MRHIEDASDLFAREVQYEPEHENLSVLEGESRQRPLDIDRFERGRLGPIWRRVNRSIDLFAGPLEEYVPRDPEEPRGDTRLSTVSVGDAQSSKERVLREVGRGVAIGNHPSQVREYAELMLLKHLGEVRFFMHMYPLSEVRGLLCDMSRCLQFNASKPGRSRAPNVPVRRVYPAAAAGAGPSSYSPTQPSIIGVQTSFSSSVGGASSGNSTSRQTISSSGIIFSGPLSTKGAKESGSPEP